MSRIFLIDSSLYTFFIFYFFLELTMKNCNAHKRYILLFHSLEYIIYMYMKCENGFEIYTIIRDVQEQKFCVCVLYICAIVPTRLW